MTRLIDGDALVELINGGYDLDFDEVPETKRELIRMIMEQPTVDAVPIIRCKDCKYWETDDDESFCSDWGAYGTGAKSYCSFAKRKEE